MQGKGPMCCSVIDVNAFESCSFCLRDLISQHILSVPPMLSPFFSLYQRVYHLFSGTNNRIDFSDSRQN